MFDQLSDRILDFVKQQKVGHLSVRTKKGVLVHPIAYYCDGESLVFGTPRTSSKIKILKANPRVSFTVDNGKLMKEAIGITVIGKTEIFTFKSLTSSLRMALTGMFGFLKKYPELLKFYVGSMGELPDDRKFYKYRFIRIIPSRIVHWDGYEFGRITSKSKKKKVKKEAEPEIRGKPEDDPVLYAKYVMDYFTNLEELGEEFEDEMQLENLTSDIFTGDIHGSAKETDVMDVTTLLSLPVQLRKTGLAILKLGKGSVADIAAEMGTTDRETKSYLDRLTLMNILKKKREGDQLIYYSR
jgi:hypothetical protein